MEHWKVAALTAPILAVVMVGCVGQPGSGSAAVAPTAAAATTAATSGYTGEQLYRGIMLLHGPVADAIPEIRDNLKLENFQTSPKTLATVRRAEDKIVALVRSSKPEFFDAFKAQMESGDHLVIQKGLWDAGLVTQAAVDGLPGTKAAKARLAKMSPAELGLDGKEPQTFAELKSKTQEHLVAMHGKGGVHADDYCATCVEDGGSGGSDDGGGADDGSADDGGDDGTADDGGGGDDGTGPVAGLSLIYKSAAVVLWVAVAAAVHIALVHNISVASVVAAALAAVVALPAYKNGVPESSLIQEQLVHSIAVHLVANQNQGN